MHRTYEISIVSEIPYIINDENVKTVSILSGKFYKQQAFPYLLPKCKFCYKVPRDIATSPAQYSNQRLLSFN